jgi:transcription-repair coupling factor (superfamily II helicase)
VPKIIVIKKMPDIKKLSNKTIFSCLPEGADALALSEVVRQAENGILHIARDDKRMEHMAHAIGFFSPTTKIIKIPAWDCLPYDRISPSINAANQRTEALCELITVKNLKNTIILTPVNSILQRTPPGKMLAGMTFKAKPGDKINREDLIKHLIRSGYIRSANANEAGEIAVRGSIIDIFPSGMNNGLRLDFFGDVLESIRNFDPLTQISGNKRDSITLMPASEIIIDEETIKCFRNSYRKLFGTTAGDDPLYDAISEGRQYAGMEHWLPLFYDNLETIFDYLPNSIVSLDYLTEEAEEERFALISDYYDARKNAHKNAFGEGSSYNPIPPDLLYLNKEDWLGKLGGHKVVRINQFAAPDADDIVAFPFKPVTDFSAMSKTSNKNTFELMKDFIAERKLQSSKEKKSLKVIIACFSEGSRERLRSMLNEHDLHTIIVDKWEEISNVKGKSLCLIILDLEKGFQSDEFIIISEQDLLGERLGSRRVTRKRAEDYITEAASLSEGELVVHKEHGLGRFEALETLTISGENHDCLRVVYFGGDKIYVPVENIDSLSRYGAEEENIKLDKLGSASWQMRKAALKKRIKIIAEDLIKTAAERELKTAPKLRALEGMYEEFCARFPYVETDDQLRCIQEVADDLSSGKPMDRLICGDVGFGKTEIALRAAFIAASDDLGNKQVAIIAPTTLLCRQHAKTFKDRFAGFPFEVRDLSRLTLPKAAKATKVGLKEGKVDIVVGTHSLLAKSLEFKNLGLVIIDEEQQFGVVQKERFKQMRADIHVLSLSATPIPRTLQMSLSGIKDLSIIATPPVDRLAIRSFTMPFDPVVIRNAILREHYRGGSTFFVVPRIKDLSTVEEQLQKLIPEVKMVKAHGQMTPADLDNTMNDFYDGKYDVLLSTNIIGSGIDLPTANTIIIYKSDMFGLAQLYQMRGRVGRSKTRAYAYFTISLKRIPSKTAMKRLEVIQNIDALGAGFSVASHDMDIRGFGNMLGDEQSGQVREVGIELYQDMLREAIENAKASLKNEEEENERWNPSINLGIAVLIPEEYVADIELRLGLYKRIANLETNEDLEQIAAEMIDRFGPLPKEVSNLLDIMKIKQQCIKAGIDKIDVGPKGIILSFHNNKFKNPDALINFIAKNPLKTKIRGDQKLVFLHEWPDAEARLKGTRAALDNVVKLAA